MQKNLLMALAIGTLSTAAIADETSMNSLSYRVKAKEFHYELGMGFGKSKFETAEFTAGQNNTTDRQSYEVKNTQWKNDFQYGITDAFSVGLGLDLTLSNKLNQKSEVDAGTVYTGSTGAQTATNYNSLTEESDGLGDFRLYTSYRFMDSAVKADMHLGVALSGKAKAAGRSTNSSGNYVVSEGDAKSGGSSIQLGTQFAGAVGAMEWSTAVGLDYKMKKKITVVNGDLNSTASANSDYEQQIKSKLDFALGVAGQYNVTPAIAVGANLVANMVSKEETTASVFAGNATATNIAINQDSYMDLTLGLEARFQAMENLSLGLNYSHLFGADIDGSRVDTQSGVATRTVYNTMDRKDDSFGFDIQVRF